MSVSRDKLRSELTDAVQALQHQIEMRSIGSTGRLLVIKEVQRTLAELRQALADLDAEEAEDNKAGCAVGRARDASAPQTKT